MASKKTLTKEDLESFHLAFDHFFPEGVVYSSDRPFTIGNFSWKDRAEFIADIKNLTGIEIQSDKDFRNIKASQQALGQLTGGGEEKAESTTPDKWRREQMEAERVKRETETKKTVENAKADVQRAIDRQVALQEKLKGQKLYAKVTPPPDEPPKDIKKLDKLKNLAKEAPHQLQADLETQIQEKISGFTSPEEAKLIAAKVSYDVVAGLNNPDSASASQQTAILSALSKDASIDPELRVAAENLAFFQNSTLLSRQIVSSFNPDLANAVFGPDPDSFRVNISASQMEGFTHSIDTPTLSRGYADLLKGQSRMFDSISSFGTGEIKQVFLTLGRAQLDRMVASLPADSMISALYRSAGAQQALEYFGLTKSFALSESFAGQMILKIPGASPLFEGLGKIFGVDVIGSVAGTGVKTAALAAGETAAAGAATAAITAEGAVAAASAAAAPVTGGLSLVVAAAASVVGPKVIKFIKDNFYKIKDFIVGAGGAVLGGAIGAATGFGIVGGSIIGGLGGFGLSRFLSGGLSGVQASVSSIAKGALNAGWIIGATALAGMGTPILVTLLVFPVAVALILFIVNSGAYVVPPSLSGLNRNGFTSPYVDIKKTANPSGPFANSALPEEITYTITVKPKKGALNNVLLTYDCQVVSKTKSSCPPITLGDAHKNIFSQSIPTLDPAGITFTYKSTYDSSFRDSAIIDSVKLSAIAQDGNTTSAEVSADVQFGTPPISCPVLGGHVASPQWNFSLNQSQNTGHGSRSYWQAMEQSPSSYALPQSSGCHSIKDCSFYGYAYDVFPTGSSDVYAPTVLGKDVAWNCSYAFPNGKGRVGHTYHCIGNDGDYLLVLTHMKNGAKTGPVKSGEKIGQLFPQGGNTHLHMEFQLNGRYVKPESYFCGGK